MNTKIDIEYDFTSDCKGYWDGFWNNKDGLGAGNCDPDTDSKILREYHQTLWSRELPNGQIMNLEKGTRAEYLKWNGERYSSDSILVSFRYKKYRYMHDNLKRILPNYKEWMEHYIHSSYTVGGMIIFPKKSNGLNPKRGINRFIRDRWDLTLECIRRWYAEPLNSNLEYNPLYQTIKANKGFFELFCDFKGYIDFFFLQDCVSDDYKTVIMWCDTPLFVKDPFPRTIEEYICFIDYEMDFCKKRRKRIEEYFNRSSY